MTHSATRRPLLRAAIGLGLLSAVLSGPAVAAPANPSRCQATGGEEAVYHYYHNTNDAPRRWVQHGGSRNVCVYTRPSDGSRIAVFSSTLQSPHVTQAALAYYRRLPFDASQWNGSTNPSYLYCPQLGGSISSVLEGLGTGSGWARKPGDDPWSMCVFPDGSAIDSWGLMYHIDGTVRGIDLGRVLAFPDPAAR